MLTGKRMKTEKKFEITGLGDEQVRKVHEAFELFDYKKTGKADLKDVKAVLQAIGMDRGPSLFNMITGFQQKEAPVDISAFVEKVAVNISDCQSRTATDKIFELFDTQKLGLISVDDLKKINRQLNLQDDDVQVETLARGLSANGKISKDDFHKILSKSGIPA